jgi:Flp pilus assembly CpaE family ATPase
VKSGARLAATLRQRYGRERVKVVLSRTDRQADIGITDVERTMGAEIAFTFPSDYRLALHALNLGRPLALDPGTDLSAAFKRFAEQLSGRKHDDSPAPARLGLFGRLTQPKRA